MSRGVKGAGYSASGRWLLTWELDDTWAIRPAHAPAEVVAGGFTTVRPMPGAKWLVTTTDMGTAIRPEADPSRVALGGLQAVHASPDAQQVLTQDAVQGFVLRNADLTPIDDAPTLPDQASTIRWSPDGQRIAMATGDNQMTVVPLAAGRWPTRLYLDHAGPSALQPAHVEPRQHAPA